MTTTNISFLKSNLISVFDNVVLYNDPTIVKTKRGNAIIISEADYNAIQETIHSIPQKGLIEYVKEGEKEDITSMSTYDSKERW